MSEWKVYFYLEGLRRDNAIKGWLKRERVPTAQIAAFQDKIDTLEENGPEMVPGFITETPVAKDIFKMKIKGNKGMKQLRPMCCRGPFGPNEYTILVGAVEKDRKLVPGDAKKRAQDNLKQLKADPSRRINERLVSKPEERVPERRLPVRVLRELPEYEAGGADQDAARAAPDDSNGGRGEDGN